MSELLTLDEAAARVRLSPWAIRRAIRRGELTAYKPAGRIRIPEEDLERWLNLSTIRPQTTESPPARPLPDRFPPSDDAFRTRARRKSGECARG